MKNLRILAIAVVAFFLVATLAPSSAHADTTTTIIVVASIVGGLMVVALVATLIIREKNKNKIFKLDDARGSEADDGLVSKRKVGFLTQCPMTADGRPMVCW